MLQIYGAVPSIATCADVLQFCKRIIFICKRALYIRKRAQWLHKRALVPGPSIVNSRRCLIYQQTNAICLPKSSTYPQKRTIFLQKTYLHIYINEYTYVYIYGSAKETRIYVYIHIFIYIYIYTHIRI